MNTPVLIFDFDGTIADTHHYIIEISNRLADEFGYKKILPGEVEGLKDKTSREIIKILRVPVLKIPAILIKAKKEFYKGVQHVKPVEGLKPALNELKSSGARLGILSSNSSENIHRFLKDHQIDLFDFIHTTRMVWSKNTAIKSLIKEKGLDGNNIIYIGDETRDIDAARKSGVRSAAVTWGYNSHRVLDEFQPDYLLHSPDELISLCG